MSGRVLHILSQRPDLTGSGVTLAALTRQAGLSGWTQAAVVGTPLDDPAPAVGDLPPADVFPVTFGPDASGAADLPFPLPGMSDVMPYPSSVWSSLDADRLEQYRRVWRRQLERVIARFRPDLVHAHHVWLVSSLLPEVAPGLPLVLTCHATGLRQMELCPHLVPEVLAGCRQADHIFALRRDQQEKLVTLLGIDPARISLAGVGFREDLFHPDPGVTPDPDALLFVGKFSHAKGLPWLLDALENLRQHHPTAVLHLAGGGAGAESEELDRRLTRLGPAVVRHGQLNQENLAHLMRRCRVCVLPSFYEGVPLVLAEAAACGCRVVATDLPGIREQLAPCLGHRLTLVPLPPLQGIDRPAPAGLPRFTRDLERALAAALLPDPPAGDLPPPDLDSLTWKAVFDRIETIWRDLVQKGDQGL